MQPAGLCAGAVDDRFVGNRGWLLVAAASRGKLGLAVLSLGTAPVAALFVGKGVRTEGRAIERELIRAIRAVRHKLDALRREHTEAPSRTELRVANTCSARA